jgi:hypothetical protein
LSIVLDLVAPYRVGMTTAQNPGAAQALGELQPVDLQLVWAHEALSFTPWLLANAEVLGKVLGMQLDLTAAEHAVGDFSLDLIGRDDMTDEVIIIENQLTRSDHDHLGKLLTYAGGTDAVNVVWLAKQFRAEHRAALEWLNARTDERTRFFAVEISAVRIGDSLPAPLFRLVVQPNDWGKSVKTTVPPTSQKSLAYSEFWTRFLQRVADDALGWTTATKPPKDNWIQLPSGRSDMNYACSFTKKGLLSEIYFGASDPAVNTRRFQAAVLRRSDLDVAFGAPFSYEDLPANKGCRIGAYHPGIVDEVDQWDTYIDWFVDSHKRLRSAIATVGGLAVLAAPGP